MAKVIFLEACVKNSVHRGGGCLLLVRGVSAFGPGVCFWSVGGSAFGPKVGVCFWSREGGGFSRPTAKGEVEGDLVQAPVHRPFHPVNRKPKDRSLTVKALSLVPGMLL